MRINAVKKAAFVSTLLFGICYLLFVVSACFSPYTGENTEGEGSLTINLATTARAGFSSGDPTGPDNPANFRHQITLIGSSVSKQSGWLPAGTLTYNFTGVSNGSYDIVVEARHTESFSDYGTTAFPTMPSNGYLRALGFGTGNVSTEATSNIPVTISMSAAVEIADWDQFDTALGCLNTNNLEEIFVLTGNIEIPFGSGGVYI